MRYGVTSIVCFIVLLHIRSVKLIIEFRVFEMLYITHSIMVLLSVSLISRDKFANADREKKNRKIEWKTKKYRWYIVANMFYQSITQANLPHE